MAIRSIVCPVHIGRDADVAVLRESAAAVDGCGRAVLVGGEAGVGKTRLVGEAHRIAESSGFAVLSAACDDGAGGPYAPLAAALRRHLRTRDTGALSALFSGPALQAASLLPEYAATMGVDSTSTAAPEHLQAALWHTLRRLAEPRPLLLVIEDIHWASVDTLRLVSGLVDDLATLPLWLVATYRTDELHRSHPLSPIVTALRRAPNVDVITLEPLDREDQRRMFSALFGGTSVGDELLDAVHERCEGNPFFIEELAAVMFERGDVFEGADGWDRRSLRDIEMPLTVRDALLARFARLDAETTRVLQLAAIAGERIDPRVVARAADVDRTTADAALVTALRSQVLVERRDGSTLTYAFRHALTREALEQDLLGPERANAHRRVAMALAGVHAADLDAVAAELSDHHERAGDVAEAAAYALRAARHAAAQHAPAAAGELFQRALRGMESGSDERLTTLIEAAAATYSDQDRRLSGSFAREARSLARERLDRVAEARAVLRLAVEVSDAGDSDGAVALSREAADLCAGRDDRLEGVALQTLGRRLTVRGEHDAAMTTLERAIELARRAGDDATLARAHSSRMLIVRTDEERDAALEESLRCAQAAGDRVAELLALNSAGFAALWTGRIDRAVRLIARSVEVGERVQPNDVGYFSAALGWVRAMSGDHEAALAAALPLRFAEKIPTRMVALTALAEVHLCRGELATAREEAEENLRLAEANGETQRIDPALAHVARVRLVDDPTAADDIVDRFLRAPLRAHVHALVSPDLARGLLRQGDGERLRALVEKVERITDLDRNRHNEAGLRLCEAALHQLRGEPGRALHAAQTAAGLYAAMPYPARETESLLAVAEASTETGDAAECAAAAERASAIAQRLRSPWLLAEAQTRASGAASDVVLATVLVTDIVDSTRRAAALGDRAWRELLERHHAIVRRELRRHRGREIDTAGDGFLVAFDSPARGIRCALDAVRALRSAGIDIRAGLHTGECEVIGDKLAGIAVHTAARVAGLAGCGEVLVSSTVRELVAGAGLTFDDRGVHTLRGVPGEWRLSAAVADTPAARRAESI